MATYQFGKQFTYPFYARDKDGAAITTLQASPSIWIYSEKPSRETVRTETGTTDFLVGSEITTWTQSGNAWNITIPQIADPDTDDNQFVHTYYIGIRYQIESGGDELISISAFELTRPFGYDNELNVTTADIMKFFPQVDEYHSTSAQTDFLDEATRQVKADLNTAGYELYKGRNFDGLRYAVIWKTLYLMALALNLQNQEDEGLRVLIDESKEQYTARIQNAPIELDTDDDGEADTEVTKMNIAFQVT